MRPSALIARTISPPSLGLLAAAGLALPADAQTFVWRGGGPSDEWRFRQNWKPEGIPGIQPVGANASIGMGGSTVLGWSNVVLNSLTVEGSTSKNHPRLSIGGTTFTINVGSLRDVAMTRATLVANGPVSLDGEVTVLESTFRGTGDTAQVGGEMNIGRGTFDGSTFRNLASVTQDLGVSIVNGAAVLNSGRWEITGISANGSIGPFDITSLFSNSGQLVYRSSQGPGFGGSIGSRLNNNGGTIIAEIGTLDCAGGGDHRGGSWLTSGPGVLRMRGQSSMPLVIAQAVTASGDGVLRLGPHVYVGPGAPLTVSGISFIDGDITCDGPLINTGAMTWAAGTLRTIGGNNVLSAAGSTFFHRDGVLKGGLEIAGTARQEGRLEVHNGAELIIAPGAEWLSITGDIGRAQLPSTARIVCRGTLRKPSDQGVAASGISVPLMLDQNGVLNAQASHFNVTGGGLAEGNDNKVVAGLTGEVRFSEMPFVVGEKDSASLTLEGQGTVRILTRLESHNFGSATNNLGGGGLGLAILDNGEVAVRFFNHGLFDWRSGTVSGQFDNDATVLISGGQANLRGLLHNENGTVRQTGGPLAMTGRVDNVFSTWELVGTVAIFNTGTGEFLNNGTLLKTGAGTAQVTGRFNAGVSNLGTVEVRQGTLILSGPVIGISVDRLDNGTWIVHPGARLVTPGVTISAIGVGAGVKISGDFEDRWSSLSELQENGGTFTVNGRGDATTLEGGLDNTGTLVSEDGGELHAPEPCLTYTDGAVEQEDVGSEGPEGGFFFPALINEGTIRPGRGEAPGPFRLVGTLEMRPSGRIEVELGGPEPYFHYDRADITGAALLAGTLDVRLLATFMPEEGETFRILEAGSISGEFDTVAAPPGLALAALYDATGVTLRVEHACYPDCDPSSGPGVLDIFDFLCFQNLFDAADPYACGCDLFTGPGVCDVFDFLCFLNAFATGCP